MRIRGRMLAAAMAIAVAAAVPAVSLIAPANAETGPILTDYKGKTIAEVSIRKYPTQASKKLGTLKKNTTITTIMCKVEGPNVDGNRSWYLYDPPGKATWGWSSARYVKNVGKAPQLCKMGFPDGQVIAKPAVKLRTSPSLTAKTAGTLKYGTKLHTICKINGPKVDGNPRWYQLFDGSWVPARWVKNINYIVPSSCT